MKMLALHMAYFRLPDDFSGSISDALRCMADYHEQSTIPLSKCSPMPLDTPLSSAFNIMFDEFIDAVQIEKRLVGMLQISDFDPKVRISDI
jgi:hypothetical protein